uniref:hypothetical protein n=1 Tax=Burkholderia arboris TaxID=488730 RepID=UPI003BEF2726
MNDGSANDRPAQRHTVGGIRLQRVLDEMQAGRAYEPVGLGDRLGMVASPVRTRLEELARAGVVEEVMFWNGGGRRRSRFLD